MPDAIPHEALARAVRAAFGARIVGAQPLFGDASSRRYVRLHLAGGGAPPTAVAMLLGADRFPLGSDEIGERALTKDLPFVDVGRYLAARGFAVPLIHHDASATDSLLLLEDLGDTTLWAAASARPADARPLFAAAVELLAEPFEQRAPVLVHRDFMAWNLHVQDGRLRLLDFQDALLGPDAYDLAALLTDRTTGTLVAPDLERELIAHFRAARAAAALPVDGDLAARYRLCALHRALKVMGRFYYLERALAAEARNVVLDRHHLGRRVEEHLGDAARLVVRLRYSRENPIHDTGGGIKRSEPLLAGEPFAVLNGDSLLELRLAEVVERHRERGAVATMVVRPDPDAERYGLVELDADDRVRRVTGPPPGAPGPLRPFMFPGLQVFESAIFDWMDAGAAFSVTRVTYPRLLKAGAPVQGFVT